MVTPTARGAQGVRRTHTPTDSLPRRLMVLPSPRRMTSDLYNRWMTPVLCVLMIPTPRGLYKNCVRTVSRVYLSSECVCVECFDCGREHVTLISVHLHTILLTAIKQEDEITSLRVQIVFYDCCIAPNSEIIFLTDIISTRGPCAAPSKWCSMLICLHAASLQV